MAFEPSNSKKNKNMVIISMVSKKTQKHVAWTHLVESFCKQVFNCSPEQVTIEMLLEHNIPQMFESQYLEMNIVDTTIMPETINPEDY